LSHRDAITRMLRTFEQIPEFGQKPPWSVIGRTFMFTIEHSVGDQPEVFISTVLGIKWVHGLRIIKIPQTTIYGGVCTGLVYRVNQWHAKVIMPDRDVLYAHGLLQFVE